MQNSVILDDPAWQAALARHYGTTGDTLVMCEMPIVWTFSQRTGQLYPDLLIAFDVDRDAAIARRCFALDERGSHRISSWRSPRKAPPPNDYETSRRATRPLACRNTGGSTPPAATTTRLPWQATGWWTVNTSP